MKNTLIKNVADLQLMRKNILKFSNNEDIIQTYLRHFE